MLQIKVEPQQHGPYKKKCTGLYSKFPPIKTLSGIKCNTFELLYTKTLPNTLIITRGCSTYAKCFEPISIPKQDGHLAMS